MELQERYDSVLGYFQENVPEPKTELEYGTPFQLLVAVILSAQCTDKRVNMVTPALFAAYPDSASMARADFDDLFPYLKSVSYPNSKTTHVLETAKRIEEDFHGEVPSDLEDLMSLPGVGRKTASVIASIVYKKPYIAVDTHVMRVSRRIGLSTGKTPEAVQDELHAHVPEGLRATAHHWLILHGRYVCQARRPRCGECPLKEWCEFFQEQPQ